MSEKSLVVEIEQAEQSGQPLRWLDWVDYGQKVILNGKEVPWGDPTALVQFFGQGAALLKLGVSDLNLGDYFDWWLQDNPPALEAMQGKKRIGFALKTLLGNPSLRASLKEIVGSLAAASNTPLILSIPSPRQLLPWAHDKANGTETETVDDVVVDSATVYLADFLREFSDSGIAGIHIREQNAEDFGSTLSSLYKPLNNIADAYRWTVGLDLDECQATDLDDFDIVICKRPVTANLIAHPLPDSFWETGKGEPGAFLYGKVPVDAIPERVLEVLDRAAVQD